MKDHIIKLISQSQNVIIVKLGATYADLVLKEMMDAAISSKDVNTALTTANIDHIFS